MKRKYIFRKFIFDIMFKSAWHKFNNISVQ
jgi:hypothetical protein